MIAAEAARVLARSAVVVVAVHVQDFLAVDGQQPTVAAKVASLSGVSQGGVVQAGGTQWVAQPPATASPQPFVVQPAMHMVAQPALPQPVAQVPLPTGNAAR